MKEEWFKLYESMLKEMDSCRKLRPHSMAEIECSFNLAQKYWEQIQAKIEEPGFLSVRDEIEFYKSVKPMFKSQIEYCNLLYQSEIFKPKENPGEMKEFWIREQHKLNRFIRDNEDFYVYHKSGATDRDEKIFLSGRPEDEDGKAIYPDDLIATLLALERYSQYVQTELSGL
jgi:hypothetical protein